MLELLSPAGDRDAFYEAVNNGANAVYLAGKKFGARAFAPNFSDEELLDLIKEAHILDVKVYVTVNTIIKDEEIDECIKFIKFINDGNVDGIIMQDIGLINLVHKCFPTLRIHASTNLSCNSLEKARELKSLGVKRVILARETSLDTAKDIIEKVGIEVEVFGHGALCMSYSGRCLLSSAIGKRSGNRGTCAQPCRMEYRLRKDGELLKRKFYLSPKDLCTIDRVKEIVDSGVTSLKLEGRMKRSEYVGVITRSYRKAIDSVLNKDDIDLLKKDMSLMFNRGFTKGYLFNADNKYFTNVSSSNHIGVKIGEVIKFQNHYAYIKLTDNVMFGDGLRFIGGYGDAIIVNEMFVNGVKKARANAGDIIQVRCHNDLMVGAVCLKTSDSKLISEISETPTKKIRVNASLCYQDKITLSVTDGVNTVYSYTDFNYVKAEKKESALRLIDQIRKSSDSHYVFDKVEVKDDIFLPIKEINELRRNALLLLDEKRCERTHSEFVKASFDINVNEENGALYFECKMPEQVDACLESGANVIVRDKALFNLYGDKVIYLPKRINNEGYNAKIIDCYHNVLNCYSVKYYLDNGARTIGVSVEASKNNIKNIIETFKVRFGFIPNLMFTLYGNQEVMVMKHCLICKEMGYENKGCLECKNHEYYLIDKKDAEYRLMSDGECNLVMYNSKVTNLINKKRELEGLGVKSFLVNLTFENYEDTKEIIYSIMNNKEIHFNNETLLYYEEDII